MNSHRRHIAAFTMMDVLMGMAIMSLVITMAYYVLTAAQQQLFLFGSARFELSQHLINRHDLKRQFFEASTIHSTQRGFTINTPSGIISYEQHENFLLRISTHKTDTLWTDLQHIDKEYFRQKTDLITLDSILSGVIITTQNEKKGTRTYLHKPYNNIDIINRELLREF